MSEPSSSLRQGDAPVANWGILAHVDAGKTSLTERILYNAGAIHTLGSVDAGTSSTDSMDIERQRGITVRTNVASFFLDGHGVESGRVQINLIDTPGHADFIAEVERSLAVLDAAVLVVSAVEGVQPQTVVLWRALDRLGLPVLMFINKIDRAGADPSRVREQIQQRLAGPSGRTAVLISSTRDEGTAHAVATSREPDNAVLLDHLAENDLTVFDSLVTGRPVTGARAEVAVLTGWHKGSLVPVLTGSAITGAGVQDLTSTMARLPRLVPRPDAPLSALVFKIDNDHRERLVWVRVFAGSLKVRDRPTGTAHAKDRVSGLTVTTPRTADQRAIAGPGDVAQLRGLRSTRIGDWLGRPGRSSGRRFADPTLEAVVEPLDVQNRGRMFTALSTLAEQDPLIGLRVDEDCGEVAVRLFGEVQKDVITSLLASQFQVDVTFRETTTRQIERIRNAGHARADFTQQDTQYLATLGLNVAPAPIGTGVTVDLHAELGSMPSAFFTATRKGIGTGLAQGLYGWAIPDAHVTITHTGYAPRQSHSHQKFSKGMSSIGADFRYLAPMLLHQALVQAGTTICEPVNSFTLDTAMDTLDAIMALIARHEGVVNTLTPTHDRVSLTGMLPARRGRDIVKALPDLARGEATLALEHDHYRPMVGPPSRRRRTGADPLDADAWQRANPR